MERFRNRITELFKIRYPVIQGGMIWCAGWELAAAVSNAGGLGLIGSGSMSPDILRHHIRKTRDHTDHPFGVNVPLIYKHAEENIRVIIEEKVPVVFTSAGNPAKYTRQLKQHGIKVAHVVANLKFALKAMDSGVDAVVAEGFEAGGHNGREETTTMVLIPWIRKNISLPLIAAGGISSGQSMLAAFALGAEGVQMGSLFVASREASCHEAFKQKVIEAGEGDTKLSMKKLIPVRLLNNAFSRKITQMEESGTDRSTLAEVLGKGRARLGMFEGNTDEGELEIGQASMHIGEVRSVAEIFNTLITEFDEALARLIKLKEQQER